MPTYSYVCDSCGIMDIVQKMTDDALVSCPECDSQNFKKKLNLAGVQFKGSGFYITDSRSK